MAPGVHVINPEAALVEHKIFEWGPMTMLHELAHAYHIVNLGYDDPIITKSFTSAMARDSILKFLTEKKRKLVKAYAASNKAEYFAEATEAYFGHNDWFPHNKKELKNMTQEHLVWLKKHGVLKQKKNQNHQSSFRIVLIIS